LDISDAAKRQRVSLAHKDDVMTLAFSADGCSVVAGGEDGEVVLWNVQDATRLLEVKLRHAVRAVAFAPNDRHIVSGGEDGTVTVWDTTSKAEVADVQLEGVVMALAMTSSPDLLAVGTSAKSVTLFAVPSLTEIVTLSHDGEVRSLSFSPDGKMLAGGGGTDFHHGLMTKKLDASMMKTVVWQVASSGAGCCHLGTVACKDIVNTVSFSPSGELLASGGEGGVISLMLVKSNFKQTSELHCPAGVRSISWSPDSHYLASGGEDKQVSVWDLLTEQVIFQLPKAKDWLCSVAFSPARTKELWIGMCGFGSNAVELVPVSLCLVAEQPLQGDGSPKRRNSVGVSKSWQS